jgi:xylulokinase
MRNAQRTVLGIDLSTQSLSGVLLGCASAEVLWERSLAYRDDTRLRGFGIDDDRLILPPREAGEAEQPPHLFIAAFEALFGDLKSSGIDPTAIAAINCAGQQHGHVYLSGAADASFARLRESASAGENLLAILEGSFAYAGAPIWKTANTAAEAAHIRATAGGQAAIIARSGSDNPLRFSANVHRRLAQRDPAAYAATRHIVQLSSLVPAILVGDCSVPLDFGNACGTGLMNYRERDWDAVLLQATAGDLPGGAPALAEKLPRIVHPLTICGSAAVYFQKKYGLAADCRIIVGSGDNPQSKVLASGDLLSLGTSFVYMMNSANGGVDRSGMANAMYDGLGRPFNFGCRSNGALVWDRLRSRYGMGIKDYAASEAALAEIAPGGPLRFWHPDAESFPVVAANPEFVRVDCSPVNFASDFAALVDSSLGLIYRCGQGIAGGAVVDARQAMSVCGGPSGSVGVMYRIAAIWNRPVIAAGQAGAALGAALAAALALFPERERDFNADRLRHAILRGKDVFQPNPAMVQAYHSPGGYLDQMEMAFSELGQV